MPHIDNSTFGIYRWYLALVTWLVGWLIATRFNHIVASVQLKTQDNAGRLFEISGDTKIHANANEDTMSSHVIKDTA